MRHRIAITGLATAIALALTAPAMADSHAAIDAPGPDELITNNTLELAAHDTTADTGDVNWAVRDGCAPGVGTNFVGGGPNVDVDEEHARDWEEGNFSATIDITDWDAGAYCFIFNPTETDTRLTQEFFVVDDHVKVGGTIAMGEDGRGNSPTHAVEGLVGDAGAAGIVGSITVNYRELGEQVTYEADALSFRAASGVGATDPMAVADIGAASGARILVLDADASDQFDRGALVVRVNGSPSDDEPREIDGSPGSTGADSWVPMDRGNNHTGTR